MLADFWPIERASQIAIHPLRHCKTKPQASIGRKAFSQEIENGVAILSIALGADVVWPECYSESGDEQQGCQKVQHSVRQFLNKAVWHRQFYGWI
ncbi:MAG TPA: hypothetical protein PLK30_18215 [Blastocatellia bacterium]|nr:hypothetical protein [Blastocatellia bacterium]